MLFYGVSALFKPASTLLLVREMFKQRNKRAHFRVGQPIAYETYSDIQGGHKARANSIRKHLYRIGKGKPGLLPAQDPIAGPECAKALKHAMSGLERLAQTDEHIHIYLYKHSASCPIMREIGRLREVSFRAVGEGSGQRRDIDRFDPHYEHILLWNNENLEIVGAYRLAPTAQTIAKRGLGGLYTSTLFDFDERFATELEHGIEMGRSFVQPKYWGRRSLHYLWIGIGAYLAKNPQYRYMFGPVSLSQQLPEDARELLVEFYRRHFGDDRGGVAHHRPYATDPERFKKLGVSFSGQDYKAEFRELRAQLTRLGVSLPTLYRQYSELCDPGGVRFLDFGIDPDFGNCIDGFVVVDIAKIAPEKRARYVDIHRVPSQDSAA